MYPNISIHNQSLFSNQTMLKSLNNNTSPFSMENLLSKNGKSSPELTESDRQDANSNDGARSQHECDRLSPNDKPEGVRQSPNERNEHLRSSPSDKFDRIDRNDVFFGFSGCFKNRICSNCGQLDCNSLHCRINGVSESVKDAKPVLKFSVSAILGTENQARNNVNGKIFVPTL